MGRFFLDQDNSSHWYLVPVADRVEWFAWQDLESDDEASWDAPAFACRIDDPQIITFSEPEFVA